MRARGVGESVPHGVVRPLKVPTMDRRLNLYHFVARVVSSIVSPVHGARNHGDYLSATLDPVVHACVLLTYPILSEGFHQCCTPDPCFGKWSILAACRTSTRPAGCAPLGEGPALAAMKIDPPVQLNRFWPGFGLGICAGIAMSLPLEGCEQAIQEAQREKNLLECVKNARDYRVALICNRYYGPDGDLNRD